MVYVKYVIKKYIWDFILDELKSLRISNILRIYLLEINFVVN